MATGGVDPKNFFLNEAHELSPEEKKGGGRIPQYVDIAWAQKGRRIAESIQTVSRSISVSRDPLREKKFFVLANPVNELKKRSVDLRKAPNGIFSEPTSFGGSHGRVFERLGLNLIQVTEDGRAVVETEPDRLGLLASRTSALESLGAREQSRWATIELFDTIPMDFRVDQNWLSTLRKDEPADVVFELQPVLNRVDADKVLRSIAALIADTGEERILSSGVDFSGRYWFRGKASRASISAIARDFFSVQSIHAPLFSAVVARSARRSPSAFPPQIQRRDVDPRALPCVAVVDLGVPSDHIQLAAFKRGQFIAPGASATSYDDHASFVASRIVFGDCEDASALENAIPSCSFYDAVVGDGYMNRVNDKSVLDALAGVRGSAPDVRVFNLSIGDTRPLADFSEVEQREKRLLLQDLDNFALANDVIVVVAAGNSRPGVVPNPAYPGHSADARWALGPWAAGFNTLVCGAFVDRAGVGGHVATVGWPSAFTRIGPGLCGAPVPSFAAGGGDSTSSYQFQGGLGVWGFSGSGMAEDRPGTSFAAPILAREAAQAFRILQDYCAPGSPPFAVTVRAFLALTATPTARDATVSSLVKNTLGFGAASHDRLLNPRSTAAVLFWQGVIQSPSDVVRVQIPVPRSWLSRATSPTLRICLCYDPPVNEAARDSWACRKVKAVLHTGVDSDSVRAPSGNHPTYPLVIREYKLKKYSPEGEKPTDSDMWLLEIQYDEIFSTPPGMSFDPQQRVAVVGELVDLDDEPLSPQSAIQALPMATSMTRLSIMAAAIRNPVLVRTRT